MQSHKHITEFCLYLKLNGILEDQSFDLKNMLMCLVLVFSYNPVWKFLPI